MPTKSLKLKHTLRLIGELNSEISEIESEIKRIMDQITSPSLTIPGIGYRMGAMSLAEIGDFSRFDSPDKILAYAGASLYLSIRAVGILLFPYGKAWLSLSAFCPNQCR